MKQWAQILHKPLEKPLDTFVLGVIDTQNKDEKEIRNNWIDVYRKFFKDTKIQGVIVS